jgi:chorismate dehydratase
MRRKPPIRIGVVSYLNARPLSLCLARLAPGAQIVVDVPSRLADALGSGDLDVALVSSIQHFRTPGSTIVSDACVACRGRVRSLKLYGRVLPERVHTLALDEGSRTSAVLTRILLKERFGLEPRIERLPIGASAEDTAADAVMLIGDRGMRPVEGRFAFVWDLGEEWVRWTGLPFVCAMWVARPRADLDGLEQVLEAARDEGQRRLAQIARLAAPEVGIPEEECLAYLQDDLVFRLGERERQGLLVFSQYAVRHGLAATGGKLVFYDPRDPAKGD